MKIAEKFFGKVAKEGEEDRKISLSVKKDIFQTKPCEEGKKNT